MNISEFKKPSAKLIPNSTSQFYTFVPDNLPIKIEYDDELIRLLSDANQQTHICTFPAAFCLLLYNCK